MGWEQEIIENCRAQLAIEREFLNTYGIDSIPGRTNIAMMFVKVGGNFVYSRTAFSATSKLNAEAVAHVVKSVPANKKDRIFHACIANNPRCANHTEPKLLYDFFSALPIPGLQGSNPDAILLATELDCCPSCNKNSIDGIKALQGMLAITKSDFDLYVVEVNYPNEDQPIGRLTKILKEQ